MLNCIRVGLLPIDGYASTENLGKHESTMVEMIDRQFALADEVLDLVLDKLMRQFAETLPLPRAVFARVPADLFYSR